MSLYQGIIKSSLNKQIATLLQQLFNTPLSQVGLCPLQDPFWLQTRISPLDKTKLSLQKYVATAPTVLDDVLKKPFGTLGKSSHTKIKTIMYAFNWYIRDLKYKQKKKLLRQYQYIFLLFLYNLFYSIFLCKTRHWVVNVCKNVNVGFIVIIKYCQTFVTSRTLAGPGPIVTTGP